MTQDYQRIEKLIERFFEGQTSNEEERELYAFFSNDNIPEHLLPYRPVFAYFENGIKEEGKINPKTIRLFRKKRISIWLSVAASVLILLSIGIYHFTREKEYNPYEGSYIIRNGVKITDPKIVNPEIEKTLELVIQQEKDNYRQLQQLKETNKEPYVRIAKELKQKKIKKIEQIKNETLRNKFLETIEIKL